MDVDLDNSWSRLTNTFLVGFDEIVNTALRIIMRQGNQSVLLCDMLCAAYASCDLGGCNVHLMLGKKKGPEGPFLGVLG